MNLSRAFAKLSGVYAAVSAQEGIPVLHKEFWSIPCGGSGNFFKMSNWFVQYKFQTLTSIELADFHGVRSVLAPRIFLTYFLEFFSISLLNSTW